MPNQGRDIMSPAEKVCLAIDQKLILSSWVIQDMKHLDLSSALGIAVQGFPTSTGEVDYVSKRNRNRLKG